MKVPYYLFTPCHKLVDTLSSEDGHRLQVVRTLLQSPAECEQTIHYPVEKFEVVWLGRKASHHHYREHRQWKSYKPTENC